MRKLRVGSLFSGVGGFDLGLERAGFDITWQVERDDYCREVLKKHWPTVPNFGDINDVISEILSVCEAQNNKQLHSDILRLLTQRTPQGGSQSSAKDAEQQWFWPHPSSSEGVDSVQRDADMNPCEVQSPPTLAAGHGCADQGILTGRTAKDTSESIAITEILKSGFGGAGSLRETNIHAKNAAKNQNRKANSMPTTSKHGRQAQPNDSLSRTASPYASDVTKLFTPGGVDVITGGVPCQPASCAGKRQGSRDDRWLWPETLAVIRFFQPTWVILENVYGLVSIESGLAFESVCATLESFGYDVQPFVIPACAVDAPHIRKRIWIVAYTESDLRRASRHDGPEAFNGSGADVGYTSRANGERRAGSLPAEEAERGCQRLEDGNLSERFEHAGESSRTGDVVDSNREPKGRSAKPRRQRREWPVEPCVGRVAHGVPNRVDRLKGLGNAIVPQIAEALGRLILAAEGR